MRWIVLGAVGFLVWLSATFAVVYAAVDLAQDDRRCEEATGLYATLDTAYRSFREQAGPEGGDILLNAWVAAFGDMIAACSLEVPLTD